MLSWFRQRSRAISASALVSLITLLAWSSGLHQDDGHDPDGGIVLHDESDHAVGRPQAPGDEPLHCVLCHWTRLVRPLAANITSFAPSSHRARGIGPLVVRTLHPHRTALFSPRGPPAFPAA